MFNLFTRQDQRNQHQLVVRSSWNRWDWALLPLVLFVLGMFAWAAMQMSRPFVVGEQLAIQLDYLYLPYYLLRTVLRMFLALAASLLFSLLFAAIAVKYRWAEKVMIPLLDVLQSVPILGFQAIAIAPFIALFAGDLLGIECAAIFAIFTSQAWNMAFSLYQAMRNVPAELNEAAQVFQLSAWQRFWRLELPYAMPDLLWNMMMSMSGGWFFLVAAEAISVAGQDIKLPGIGSYIAVAIEAHNGWAISAAMLTMLFGILIYDQLFFRPLLAWADKFRFEENPGVSAQQSWLLDFLRRSRGFRRLSQRFWLSASLSLSWFKRSHDGLLASKAQRQSTINWQRWLDLALAIAVLAAIWQVLNFIQSEAGWLEVWQVAKLGFYTLLRVVILIIIATLIWLPLAVWIGLRPRYAQGIQAIAQFLAAFPINLLFPLIVFVMLKFKLNADIWLSPLMVFGTQWYILFNVVAGASAIPGELRDAAANLGLRGWLLWRRVYLPAVFPSYLTGAITASGGCWNASIVAEYISWGDTTLVAQGLGSYIKQMTEAGDFPRITLGIGIMVIFVMTLNHFFWRRLYQLAQDYKR